MTMNLFCRKVDVPNSPRRGQPQNIEKASVYRRVDLLPRLAWRAQIAELKMATTVAIFCRKVDVPNSPRRGHPQNVEKASVYTMVDLLPQTRLASSNRGAQKGNDQKGNDHYLFPAGHQFRIESSKKVMHKGNAERMCQIGSVARSESSKWVMQKGNVL